MRTSAPIRTSSSTNENRLSKTFSVTIAVPSAHREQRDGHRHEVGGEAGERQRRDVDRGEPLGRGRPDAVGRRRHAHAHLAELRDDHLEVLEPHALELDLAARDAARHEQRAGLDAVAHDLGARTAASSSTPSIRIVVVPAPRMCAPIRLRNAVRSVISGSRAAFSITVSPLASTAAVRRFSVAPTLGKSRTMRAPFSLLQRASTKPWTTLELRTHVAARPAEVHVELAAADVVAAGQRDPRLTAAREQRAEHVDRRPHPAHQVVGRLGRQPARGVDVQLFGGPAHSTVGADRAQHGDHHVEVGDRRQVAHDGDARREQRGRDLLQPEFFVAPETLIRARRAAARAVRRRHPSGDQRLASGGSVVLVVPAGPLLDKGRDRFLHVVRREARRLALRLDPQAVDDRARRARR